MTTPPQQSSFNNTTTKNKKLRFATEEVSHVYEVISRHDMSISERNQIWYNNQDESSRQKEQQDMIEKTIQLYMNGKLKDNDNNKHYCIRGLEYKLPEQFLIRQMNQEESKQPLFDEQKRQQLHNQYPNPDLLAKVYIEHSKHCQNAAYRIGLKDQEVVQNFVSKSQSTKTSTTPTITIPVTELYNKMKGKRKKVASKVLQESKQLKSMFKKLAVTTTTTTTSPTDRNNDNNNNNNVLFQLSPIEQRKRALIKKLQEKGYLGSLKKKMRHFIANNTVVQ